VAETRGKCPLGRQRRLKNNIKLDLTEREEAEIPQSVLDWTAGVRFPTGARYFSLLRSVQTGSGTHSASYPIGTGGSFLGVKPPRREADHTTPSSTEVKNGGIYLHSPIYLHGVLIN
jgi:hypothetical protein